MPTWGVLGFEEVARLIGALIVSLTIGVGVLVAIGTSEVRSRRGESERVAAIRQSLRERQLVGRGVRGRS